MKIILLLLIILLPCCLPAQTSLKAIRQKSYQVFAFRVAASNIEKYIQQDSIPVDELLSQQPTRVFSKDSVDTDLLPKGLYILISLEGNELLANMIGVSDLVVYPVNNQHNIQLDIRTQDGTFIPDAKVWVNGKEARYNSSAKTYWLKQKKVATGLVKVFAPGDTTFVQLEQEERVLLPAWKQRWNIFKRSKTAKFISWLPNKVWTLFSKPSRYKSDRSGASGYVLLNQPKYKLSDTVKLKAYIVTRKWKQFKDKADLFLEYYSKGKLNKQLLTTLSPVSPGSYIYTFPLSDTLPSDLNYTLVFRTDKGKTIISKNFKTEDYLLDEIGSYSLKSNSETYYNGDSLRYTVSAKDANGLNLLDGDAKLVLTTSSIIDFYRDSLQVPDTLFVQEKPLATDGETTFVIPASSLPDAKLLVNATVLFRNSNNEIHEESKQVSFSPGARELVVKNVADSIVASFMVNGKSVQSQGVVEISGDQIEQTRPVTFPARLKVDPLADDYSFTLVNGSDTLKASTDITSRYLLSFSRISREDTLGFVLQNPYAIPVTYIVLDGNNMIATGKDDSREISWKKVMKNKHKMYAVKWQYTWAGTEQRGGENIALLYKLLQVKINNEAVVFPGQKDTVRIEVTDYKNRPAAGVNLASVSYNSQFKKDIDVREPPYLVRYKNKPAIIRNTHEVSDDVYLLKKYQPRSFKKWIQRFAADTMQYYKMLFPRKSPYDVVTPISSFVPQLSIHVVQNGTPQEIYLLYLNRQFVYYNGVTDKMPYAFETMQGYSQVGIRLLDKYIEVDSLYIQPFYKHDIVIDLDSLPAHSTVRTVPVYWTGEERNLLENSLWQLDNNQHTNYGYVWQGNRLVKLNSSSKHITGPFNKFDSLHFYAPGNFDLGLKLETGYEYNLSKQVLRLEKKTIFPLNETLLKLRTFEQSSWMLGDTISTPPVISYPQKSPEPAIRLSSFADYNPYNVQPGSGRLKFSVAKDTILKYVVLKPDTGLTKPIVVNENSGTLRNIPAGRYSLLLVNKAFRTAEVKHLEIKPEHTLCINASVVTFQPKNILINKLVVETRQEWEVQRSPVIAPSSQTLMPPLPTYAAGAGFVTGRVRDAQGGNGIPAVSITVKGTQSGVLTASDGSFSIRDIKEGSYTLVVSAIGYSMKEVRVDIRKEQTPTLDIRLTMMLQRLDEVVVTAYGVAKRREITASISSIRGEELSAGYVQNSLAGRVLGVSISGNLGATSNIRIRGNGSVSALDQPIYVVDGIIYNELPGNIKPGMILSTEVLRDAAATAAFGARGANGVIIITTGAKTQRNKFSDNALWQPELFTNADGRALFEMTYPDNITGWEMYVLAMDKRRRVGKGLSFTKAYKPVAAQLSMPQFLIAGDTAALTTKSLNYTADNYSIKTKLSIDGKIAAANDTLLAATQSVVVPVPVTTSGADTLRASFDLSTSTGFKDGEERNIPVFKRGSLETHGEFYVMLNDTTVTYVPEDGGSAIDIFAQNNTLDVLLNELDHLKQYPYFCFEQVASKLKGLLMEQKIRETMKQPFRNAKEMNLLLKKLQDNQLFNGGWSWWEKGTANLQISCYVVDALLKLRKDPLVETNIRNGLLFLQNELPKLKSGELLQVISTMSSANHMLDYKPYLRKLSFDSLAQHEQWLWVKICQEQKLEYTDELRRLIERKIETMTGGIHWGVENYRWFDNANATTLLAFTVIEREKTYRNLLPQIVQYFLEQRKQGHWRNTVESASITSTLLPYLMDLNKNFNNPGSLSVAGDTTFVINTFPYSTVLQPGSVKPIKITRTGGTLTYLTLYQRWWNQRPAAVADKFNINSYFEKNGRKLMTIPAGEKVKMIVNIEALKDAEFVMIEIPIPAGCNYASKQQEFGMHREYFKNKMVVFAEHLSKGQHKFEIELEPRYQGSFTINPAKAELMYFPVLYGRNKMSKVEIR